MRLQSNAAQIRRMVVCDSPAWAAMERIDQWVASLGGVQRGLDHLSNLPIRHRARATCAIFIRQPFNAILHEPPPPFANRVLVTPSRSATSLL
jgi:hypothetical protein